MGLLYHEMHRSQDFAARSLHSACVHGFAVEVAVPGDKAASNGRIQLAKIPSSPASNDVAVTRASFLIATMVMGGATDGQHSVQVKRYTIISLAITGGQFDHPFVAL